jgi:hypothetical protein
LGIRDWLEETNAIVLTQDLSNRLLDSRVEVDGIDDE